MWDKGVIWVNSIAKIADLQAQNAMRFELVDLLFLLYLNFNPELLFFEYDITISIVC